MPARLMTSWRELKSNDFLRHNAIFWVASLGVAFLNYLYYPVLGHLLKPAQFGETQTIISVLTQTSVFLQVLGLVSIGILTKYDDVKQRERISNELTRLTLWLSIVILCLTLALSPLLKNFFHFSSITPFFLLALSILISVPLSFANAYLQGTKRFGMLSASNILVSMVKIISSVSFVLVGLKTNGAVGGLIAAQLIGLVFSLRHGQGVRNFIEHNFIMRRPRFDVIKPELPYAGMVFITSLTTNLLLSFDILVIKHYFPPDQAGLYTGISIISNIVFFVTSPLAAVLVPSLNLANSYSKNISLLKRSFILTLCIGGIITSFFLLMPHLIVSLLLGHRYVTYAGYLRGLSLALFGMSLANVLIYYHIGLRHFLVAPVVLVDLIATLTLLATRHGSLGQVVLDLVIGAALLLVLLIGMTARYHWRTV